MLKIGWVPTDLQMTPSRPKNSITERNIWSQCGQLALRSAGDASNDGLD